MHYVQHKLHNFLNNLNQSTAPNTYLLINWFVLRLQMNGNRLIINVFYFLIKNLSTIETI